MRGKPRPRKEPSLNPFLAAAVVPRLIGVGALRRCAHRPVVEAEYRL